VSEREVLAEWDRFVWGIVRRTPIHDPVLGEEDLLSAARFALLEAHASWDPKGGASLRAWIGRKVKWALLDLMKREGHARWKNPPAFEPLEEEEVYAHPGPPELSLLALPYVEDVLSRLPPRHEASLRARFFEGLTLEESARRRGVSKQAESNIVGKALKGAREKFGLS